jgi:CubicO group peptidase (beta-lactamase class C family)
MTRASSTAAAALLTAFLATSAYGADIPVRQVGPTQVEAINPIVPIRRAPAGCTDSSDNGWSALGLSSRPTWVAQCAERRLRLLPALPKMETDVAGDVSAYFGSQGPGMATGLMLDDGLYYSQGWGYRDASKQHQPDETTIFRAGSLSKVMTGTLLQSLIDNPANGMSLSDPADDARYLPELKYVCPTWGVTCTRGAPTRAGGDPIRLSHLVSHTAGLADVMEQSHADVSTWLADLKKSWLLFPPGKYGAYSGVGVEGAGLIAARISKKPYPQAAHDLLFAPLGMAHSGMDPTSPPPGDIAQRWLLNYTGFGYSFSQDNGIIPGDDQAMILPAGGLSTTVWDLSKFTSMWLTGNAPIVNGHPLLKGSTISSATTSQYSSTAAGPGYCNVSGGSFDANNFFYSQCGQAYGFGVTWYVGNTPYIMHNGDEPGRSGSETMVDQSGHMATTGLISTEPYPAAPNKGFIDNVVWGHLMNEALAADAATSWSGKPLPSGVARLLWLSGARPPQLTPVVRGVERREAPGGGPTGPNVPTVEYETALLGQFDRSFVQAHSLNVNNIQGYVSGLFSDVHNCSTFRVRKVAGARDVTLRLLCTKRAGGRARSFDLTLKVDTNGYIADITGAGSTDAEY